MKLRAQRPNQAGGVSTVINQRIRSTSRMGPPTSGGRYENRQNQEQSNYNTEISSSEAETIEPTNRSDHRPHSAGFVSVR